MPISAAEIAQKKQQFISPQAPFEIETTVIEGRSYRAYKNSPKTLIDIIQAGRLYGDQEFLIYQGARYTFSQLFERVDALAAVFQEQYGIEKGDRVAIAMRNNPEWAIAYLAGTLVGAIIVPINSWGKTAELLYALTDSQARLLICDEPRLNLIRNSIESIDINVLVTGEKSAGIAAQSNIGDFESAVRAGEHLSYRAIEASPLDHCIILYTSGSTGMPKGVLHRHIAVCQALMNMFFLGALTAELEGPRPLKGGAQCEAPLLTVPLFHATGLLGGFLIPLQMGHKVVMMHKWDATAALAYIQNEKVTALTSVPAVLQDLLRHPAFDAYDTSSLARVAAAGAATPAGLPELVADKLDFPSRSTGYGMTETMAVASTMSGAIYDLKPDSAGIMSPVMEIRFVDENAKEVATGQPGEIELYSVCNTSGYWNNPEANAATFDDAGWMKTGDVGYLDEEGYLHISGRTKEIVIRGGENIYPGEIEQRVYEISQVQENVVFGVPDDAMGEELVLIYFCTEGSEIQEQQIRDYLLDRLANYKIPKYIQISDTALPQNASGKLHKKLIREQYLKNRGL